MNGAGGGAGQFGGVQDCQGTTLNPGASCHMFYAFTPSAAGPASGSTSGTWNGQSFSLSFVGNGLALATFLISPTSFDFGDVPVGTTSPQQTVTITNVSGAPVVMNGAGGGAGQFGGVQDCQGTTLNPGASCHMLYAFTPSSLGAASGSTSGTWNGQSFSLSFKGNGINQFLITPTGFDFGDVTVGTTSPQQTVTVTNRANQPVVMNGAGGGAGQFGGVQDCQGTTLNPGASCHMFYAFTPSAAGPASGSTSGSWNGQSFSLSFMGNGLGDTTPPVIKPAVSPPAPDGSGGWYRTAPTVSWSVTDPESAITSTSGCGSTVVSSDTSPTGLTLTCTATSAGGTASGSVVIKHDGTPPNITCPPAPTFTLGSTASLTAVVADASSGPATPSVTVAAPTAVAGPHTVAVQAFDVAGNMATAQCPYLVGYAFGGFIQPGTQPSKAGSNFAVTFALEDASGNPIPDADATALATSCAVKVTFGGSPGVVVCATYDPIEKRFHATVKTAKTLDPGGYQLVVTVTVGGFDVTRATTTVQIR
jgi:hypothetical protein